MGEDETRPAPTGKETWLFVLPWTSLDTAGGVTEVVKGLYRTFRKRGDFRPMVLLPEWAARHARVTQEGEFDVARLRLRPAPTTAMAALRWCIATPIELARLWRFLRKEHVVVVNFHYPETSLTSFALLRQLRLYRGFLLASFHLSDLTEAAASEGRTQVVWHWLMRQVDGASACSEAIASRARVFFGKASAKVHVVYNGIEIPEADGTATTPQLPTGSRRYILNVGTYEWKKGQDILLRAFAKIAKTYPDLDLHLVGREGPFRSRLQELATTLDLDGRIRLMTEASNRDILLALSKAEAFVLPSRDEGFPVSLLEAGALARPVIATRLPGVEELVASDAFGILVDPEDSDQFANAMLRILSDPADAMCTGQALRRRIQRAFSSDRSYDSLVGMTRGRQRRRSFMRPRGIILRPL